MPSKVDEEGRRNDRERRLDGPLALSQTVATGPGTNLDQELRERRERSHDRSLSLSFPLLHTNVLFFILPSLLYSSLPPRFVAPIINISSSPCLTARSSALFLLRGSLLLLLLSRASLPPAHPAAYTVPIINSNLCRTLFFILPSPHRLRISIWR